jgi:rhodanese-related sulfurtransferase
MKVKSSYTLRRKFFHPSELSEESETTRNMKHTPGFLQLVDDAKSRVREVSVEEARARLAANPSARLIDVREDNEWHEAHATGARHMGRGIIERDIETEVPDKDTELILYCGGGYRSALATDNIQRIGYRNVYSMAGGWKAWKDAGAPVESDRKENNHDEPH